jgi:sialic acid synthase SpsE
MNEMKTVTINQQLIGHGNPIYIIAEMACAHDGDISKAKTIIEAAANAKADAIQLQFFSPDDLVTPDHEVYELLHTINFSQEAWRELNDYARNYSIDVFACTYDIPSAELAIDLNVDGIKLNSSDLSNPDLLKCVAESKIPFTLGTGASTIEEISQAVDTALKHGSDQLIIMHGVQNFPTAVDHASINKIKMLRSLFNFPIGYQDHTDADDPFSRSIDLLAIGAGACVIEKHLTVDRSEKGIDYQAALEPTEFRHFVRMVRNAEKAMGDSRIRPLGESDRSYRAFQKKSIVNIKTLEKGDKIARNCIAFLRSKISGLPPTAFPEIDGKRVNRTIPKFTALKNEDIVGN